MIKKQTIKDVLFMTLPGALMKKLNNIGLLLAISLLSVQSYAAGTLAGTDIANKATVTYNAGAGEISQDSNTVSFPVQEIINASIIKQINNDIAVGSGETGAYLKFTLTNLGNGNEQFKIAPANTAGDDFEVTFTNIYTDNGDGNFVAAEETLLVNGETLALAPDASVTIWVTADIPNALIDGNKSDVLVAAQSKTFLSLATPNANPNQGDVADDAGDSSTDAVFGASGVIASTATFSVSAITVTVAKTIVSVNDNINGATEQNIPGADVVYQLVVTVAGNGTATDVKVVDPLPDELELKGGILSGVITVEGTDYTSASSPNITSYDGNNDITVTLGDLVAPATRTIIFTTTIK